MGFSFGAGSATGVTPRRVAGAGWAPPWPRTFLDLPGLRVHRTGRAPRAPGAQGSGRGPPRRRLPAPGRAPSPPDRGMEPLAPGLTLSGAGAAARNWLKHQKSSFKREFSPVGIAGCALRSETPDLKACCWRRAWDGRGVGAAGTGGGRGELRLRLRTWAPWAPFSRAHACRRVRSRRSLALVPRATSWRPSHSPGLRFARRLPFT